MKEIKQATCGVMTFILVFSVLMTTVWATNLFAPNIAPIEDGATRSYQETLPIQYEIWYDKTIGGAKTFKNYVYKNFTFAHGYKATEHHEWLEMTPLECEFYDRAYLVTVTYDFY